MNFNTQWVLRECCTAVEGGCRGPRSRKAKRAHDLWQNAKMQEKEGSKSRAPVEECNSLAKERLWNCGCDVWYVEQGGCRSASEAKHTRKDAEEQSRRAKEDPNQV